MVSKLTSNQTDNFIMKKLQCDKCNKQLCTVDEMRVSFRKFVNIKLKCLSCNHITNFYLPEHLRIIDDNYNYKIVDRKKV